MKAVAALLLVPLLLVANPGALRVRTHVRGRREEFALIQSAFAGDITPTRRDTEFVVRLHVMKRDDVIAMCRSMGVWEGRDPSPRQPVGCNRVFLDRTPIVCEVYVEEPRYDRDDRMLTWGHEVFHCYAGRFHD